MSGDGHTNETRELYLDATGSVEVVEATPEEWAVIQRRLDEEDAAHALKHRMAARNLGDCRWTRS